MLKDFDITAIKSATFQLVGVMTTEMPFTTTSADQAEKAGKNSPNPVPVMWIDNTRRGVIPATGIRGGMLRRPLFNAMREAEIDRTGNNNPYTLEAFHMNIIGGVKGSEKNVKNTAEDDAFWREKNPLLSLFGAGAAGYLNMVAGKTCVSNAITQTPLREYAASGARKNDLQHDKYEMNYLSEEEKAKYFADEALVNANSTANKKIETLTAKLNSARSKGEAEKAEALEVELEEVYAARKANPDKNSIGRPLPGHLAIPQGTKLDHTMILTRANAVELGALFAAISDFAVNKPFLGAHYATGNGMVSAEWEVSVAGQGYDQPVSLGKIIMKPNHVLEVTSEPLKQALELFYAKLKAGDFDLSVPTEEKRTGKPPRKTPTKKGAAEVEETTEA